MKVKEFVFGFFILTAPHFLLAQEYIPSFLDKSNQNSISADFFCHILFLCT